MQFHEWVDKNRRYFAVFIESKEHVVIFKDGKIAYFVKTRINKNGTRVWECNCPFVTFSPLASIKPCQHVGNIIKAKFNYDKPKKVNKPRSDKAYGRLVMGELAYGELVRHLGR